MIWSTRYFTRMQKKCKSAEVSDQKSKLVFRSIWTTDECQICFVFIAECHGLDALKHSFLFNEKRKNYLPQILMLPKNWQQQSLYPATSMS